MTLRAVQFVGRDVSLRSDLHVEHADLKRPELPGEPSSPADRQRLCIVKSDPPAEERDDVPAAFAPVSSASTAFTSRAASAGTGAGLPADLKDAGVFQKEFPLLREEQAEAGQVYLLFIGFDLRKIGVDSQVQREFPTSRRISRPIRRPCRVSSGTRLWHRGGSWSP